MNDDNEAPDLTGEFLYGVWKGSKKSKREVGALFGLTYGQCAGRIWRYEQTLQGAPEEHPALFEVVLGKPLSLDGDWVVISDVQAPTTDLDMARLVVPVAELHGIRQLLINGDLLNLDWASTYPVLVQLPTASQELKAAAALLADWLFYFDRIVYLPGNHEDRFLKLHTGQMDMDHLMNLIAASDKLTVSNFDHCTIDTPNGRWFVCHGTDYSVNQLWQANWYAQKYQAHVIMGHQHHLAIGYDRYKHYILVDNGGLFDVDKMAYVKMRASKKAGMQTGFTALVDGFPHVYGPSPFTDWGRVFDELEQRAAAARPALRLADAA